MGRPIEHMVRNIGVALAVYCVVTGLPYFFLWRSYKNALPSFVSSLDEVVVSGQSKRQQHWKLVLVILGPPGNGSRARLSGAREVAWAQSRNERFWTQATGKRTSQMR